MNYQALAGLETQQQLKLLNEAIDFEFKNMALAADMAPDWVLHNTGATIRSHKEAAGAPDMARIKSFLATKYAVPSDNPQLTDVANQFAQFIHQLPEVDLGYQLLFDTVDLRNSSHDHFDVVDTKAGLTWSQRKPGTDIKIRKNITESATTVPYVEYADGLGLQDTWLQFNQFWKIEDAVNEFRATAFDKMAEIHYGLLTALGSGVNQAFDTDDVTTANKAMGSMLRALAASGLGVSQNTRAYAVCEVEQVGRLEKMLTAQRGSAIVDQGTVNQPLSVRIAGVIGTTHIPAGHSGWYLVIPGRKLKRGVWMDLTTEQQRNAIASATDIVGRFQQNAVVGSTDQVRRCLFA